MACVLSIILEGVCCKYWKVHSEYHIWVDTFIKLCCLQILDIKLYNALHWNHICGCLWCKFFMISYHSRRSVVRKSWWKVNNDLLDTTMYHSLKYTLSEDFICMQHSRSVLPSDLCTFLIRSRTLFHWRHQLQSEGKQRWKWEINLLSRFPHHNQQRRHSYTISSFCLYN